MFEEKKWTEKKKNLLEDFDELLKSIDEIGTKEKILWRQIYDNAITDRQNANLCFLDLYPTLTSDTDNHIQFGNSAVQYLTRMEKSNEQLLKLATIIQKALENQQEGGFSADDLLEEIQQEHNAKIEEEIKVK